MDYTNSPWRFRPLGSRVMTHSPYERSHMKKEFSLVGLTACQCENGQTDFRNSSGFRIFPLKTISTWFNESVVIYKKIIKVKLSNTSRTDLTNTDIQWLLLFSVM